MKVGNIFDNETKLLKDIQPAKLTGQVSKIVGLVVECEGLSAPVGSLCHIHASQTNEAIEAEIVGFNEDSVLLMPFGEMHGVSRFDKVTCESSVQKVSVGYELVGRVLDGRGNPIDEKGSLYTSLKYPIYNLPPDPIKRERIDEPIITGIKAVDALTTCGKGQRMGIFSGSGVGKSILLGMIARNTRADVNVIALIGERGREVRDFLEKDLGEEGLSRSVVIIATSNESALMRVKAPFIAASIADYFRDEGLDVILMMDSVTRMAFAQREIGLSAGEPPTTKGYPPSVFAMMPKLMERSGRGEKGSVTGFYTVLVEADDVTEPIADSVRSILDGHIWLSRDLANKGHYPAVDPLSSISRVMIDVVEDDHINAATEMKSILATYKESEDLINIGAYVKGSNPEIDKSISMISLINDFLKQGIEEKVSFEEVKDKLLNLTKEGNADKKNENEGGEEEEE